MLVENIMTTGITHVGPDDTVESLRDLLATAKYHHVPVVSEMKLVGILSDRDLAKMLSPFLGTEEQSQKDLALLTKSVSDIMTTDLITVDRTTTVDFASILLLENSISCLPVVDVDNKLVGLLTWKDILRYHVYCEPMPAAEEIYSATRLGVPD